MKLKKKKKKKKKKNYLYNYILINNYFIIFQLIIFIFISLPSLIFYAIKKIL